MIIAYVIKNKNKINKSRFIFNIRINLHYINFFFYFFFFKILSRVVKENQFFDKNFKSNNFTHLNKCFFFLNFLFYEFSNFFLKFINI
jgi:hypothetical protein